LKKRWRGRKLGYAAIAAVCFAVAVAAGWTSPALEIDNDVYDFMLRRSAYQDNALRQPESQAVIVAIDEPSLNTLGGMRKIRTILAEGLERIAQAQPRTVAIDVILADPGDPKEDARLADALRANHNLVLPADVAGDRWEEPIAAFRAAAAAIGHVSPQAPGQPSDGVVRRLPLELVVQHKRYWALALQAFRLDRGASFILESPQDLQVGAEVIPAPAGGESRPMLIAYTQSPPPEIPLLKLLRDPAALARIRGKAVFFGITALSAARDRAYTPLGDSISGLEVHGYAFQTLQRAMFRRDASNLANVELCAVIAALAVLAFALFSGWRAYLLGVLVLAGAHAAPFVLFGHGTVFPLVGPAAAAWLTVAAAASYQHFAVRGQLVKSEAATARYRQAMHFVTHEMKTPLTAIQGSSELIGRYNLNDDKRKQMAGMINQESKRLARMIETFLNVERLSEGEMQLKREVFPAALLVASCVERVKPLAESKRIGILVAHTTDCEIDGDRELMEYALYNLLNNAVKYSPPETQVTVEGRCAGDRLRISITDQGIGMDEKELKNIFRKFYRTKRAEQTGEAGTGIGLSIVEQIVAHHAGKIEVNSSPGKGSCFTMVLPAKMNSVRNPGSREEAPVRRPS